MHSENMKLLRACIHSNSVSTYESSWSFAYLHYIKMEINEAIVAKCTTYGKLCVLLRSVLLRLMNADVLRESNFTITANCRLGKFVAVDMSLVSSNIVHVFFFPFNCSLHSIFTTHSRCPPYTSLHNNNFTTEPIHDKWWQLGFYPRII